MSGALGGLLELLAGRRWCRLVHRRKDEVAVQIGATVQLVCRRCWAVHQ